jgi:hypothetical protein
MYPPEILVIGLRRAEMLLRVRSLGNVAARVPHQTLRGFAAG